MSGMDGWMDVICVCMYSMYVCMYVHVCTCMYSMYGCNTCVCNIMYVCMYVWM